MAPARLRQCGERADDVPAVARVAVVGLDPPDRQDEPAIDAKLLLDRLERCGVLRSLAHAGLDARLGGEVGDVGTDRLAELGLPLCDRHDPRIGRDACKSQVEGLPGHAFGAGVGPQLLQERHEGWRHLCRGGAWLARGRRAWGQLAWLARGRLGSLALSRRDLSGWPWHCWAHRLGCWRA